jgi:CheY-like chemotaxis protein
LPLVEALQPPPDPALAPSQRPTPLAGWRILVVDDNRDAADSLGMFLKVLGAEVRTSYDGGAALAALDVFQPTVLMLDLGMPVMDGYEVARRVREHPRGSEILLIAMTGWGQEEDRRRTAEAGFNHHLVKPVDPLVLQDLLAASHQRPANRPSTSKKPATSD